MRRLHPRGPSSRGMTVDVEGAMLGPDCVLVRRTPEGYRCATPEEAAGIQALLGGRVDDRDWLFRQCRRIAKALADRNIALAQIYGMGIPIIELDGGRLKKLASAARFIKANFDPDQPRDADGRWTDEGSTASGTPSAATPGMSPQSNDAVVAPGNTEPAAGQLAADNRRENKMVTDIVVQLRLSKDQRQELHRAISGQGLTYKELLDLAKDMFNK